MKVLSLFSGCGGLDLGFESAGYKISCAYEANASAVNSYNRNLTPVAKQVTLHRSLELPGEVDVVIAGPPCQGFSTAGGYSKDDERNSLLRVACELAVRKSPKVILIENVSGLFNKKNDPYLKDALQYLHHSEYFFDKVLVECEQFGLAQKRRRVFIIARSNNRSFSIDLSNSKRSRNTVANALTGLIAGENGHNPKILANNNSDRLVADRIAPGQKLCNVRSGDNAVHTWDIPSVFGSVTDEEISVLKMVQKLRRTVRRRDFGDADPVEQAILDSHAGFRTTHIVDSLLRKKYLRRIGADLDLTHTFNGKFRRLVNEGLSPTVDTRFGEHRLFLHPTEPRGLTVREAARLQGFPDTFVLPSSDTEAFRQVGNAVPPPVARTMAEYIRGLI